MKKKVLLSAVLLSLILILPILLAEDVILSEDDDSAKIEKAYDCLKGRVNESCSTSLEENIFVLLAIGKCEQEVLDKSDNEECWPDNDCNIKTTAQAIIALDRAGKSTSDAEDWLIAHDSTPKNIEWFLEIESPEATTCEITYGSSTYSVDIGEDKKIDSGAGSCLDLSDGSWWLKVSSSCYEQEFEISCDKSFLTTLLFKKEDSSTIHVSDVTSSASAEGTTKEKVNSLCFVNSGTCNYDGSLWATLALHTLDYDVSAYIPYLTTMAEDNEQYLPESFLYILTGSSNFRNSLLLKQKSNYWDESGDKLYDTAIALYPFQYEDSSEKTKAKDWLLEIQDKDGCWDGTKNTAFILHSIWQKTYRTTGGSSGLDCADAGYFCMSNPMCEESLGTELTSYEGCSFPNVCCSEQAIIETCADQGGDVCGLDENCFGGTTVDASDVDYGEQCCVGGTCETGTSQEADCENYGGTCRISCNSEEEESYSYTCDYGDVCCFEAGGGSGGSYWWIWLLLILIILLIIAIIFRDRLRVYWHKFRKGKSGSEPRAGFGPGQGGIPMVSPGPRPSGSIYRPQRRILPPSRRQPVRRPASRKPSEIDDVLKKLKDMGN